MARNAPQLLPTGPIAQLLRGLSYPLRAIGFIARNRLWGLTLVGIAVNVVLLVGLIFATLLVFLPGLDELDTWLDGASSNAWIRAALDVLGWVVRILAVLVIVAVNALLLLLIGHAVASPFLDMLSERIEQIVLGTPAPPFSVSQTIRSVTLAVSDLLWSLLFLAAVHLPILVVGIAVPGIGTGLAAAASFCFSGLILAQEFVTLPLGRRLVPFRRRFGVIWRNRALSLGFGLAVMALLFVPGLNLVLLPLAAAGGTLAFTDLVGAGRLELPTDK